MDGLLQFFKRRKCSPVSLKRCFAFALLALIFAGSGVARAQVGTIRGNVVDKNTGQPLPGTNVILVDTNLGAAADRDGNYRIGNIPAGDYRIKASFVGYKSETKEITVVANSVATLGFVLAPDVLQMSEIVVTGTGASIEKRKLSANVDVLNARVIEEAPVATVDQLLQGRVAGATVRMQSAQPGQGALLNFRGITSVFADQTPVIYIDGVRMDNASSTSLSLGGEATSALSELLTTDIERIEITKGGAASTLYGSDAANGVIQIFTKRGTAGAPSITFRTEQGVDIPEDKFMLDTGFAFPVVDPNSDEADPENPNFGKVDFVKNNYLRNGYAQSYYIGVSGGRPGLTYNVSGKVNNGEGVQPKNENTTYTLRGNLQADASDKLNVSFTGAYTRQNFQRLFNGTAIADPLTTFEVGDALFFSGKSTFEEALEAFLLPDINEGVTRITLSASAAYRPSPLFGSNFVIGVDNRANSQRVFEPAEFDQIGGNTDGQLERFDRDFTAVTLEYRGTISYPRKGNATSDFTFGIQGFREDLITIDATGRTFALPGAKDVDAAATTTVFETRTQIFNGGFFFKEQLGLWNRIFLDAGLRFDGNSAFGSDVGLQTYPSFGAAYTISDESFWRSTFGNIWDELKLRFAYGQTGKFPRPFDRDRTFGAVSFRAESAPRFDNPGNVDLRPEKTATFELGFDTALLNNRIGLNITFYDATTTNALFFVPEQPSTGQGLQLRNIGEIQNQGIEIDLSARVITRSRIRWNVGFQYHTLKNEVTDMGGLADFNVGGSNARARARISEGKPIGVWHATKPIDTNGDGKLDDFEFQFLDETPFPKETGSFRTDVTLFNRLTFNASLDFARGFKVLDWGSRWAEFNGLMRAFRPNRFDANGDPVLDNDGEPVPFSTNQCGACTLLDGDYLKLREISIRYSLPRSITQRFRMQNASVYLTGRNLINWTKTNLLDPELAGLIAGGGLQLGGEQSITLSPPHSWRFGIQVSY
jgi:TonB-linked SusC/RagA family outer membrane protein